MKKGEDVETCLPAGMGAATDLIGGENKFEEGSRPLSLVNLWLFSALIQSSHLEHATKNASASKKLKAASGSKLLEAKQDLKIE